MEHPFEQSLQPFAVLEHARNGQKLMYYDWNISEWVPSDHTYMTMPLAQKYYWKIDPMYPLNLTDTVESALDFAIGICKDNKGSNKKEAWNAACEAITIFLEAAKERHKEGLSLHSYAYTQ